MPLHDGERWWQGATTELLPKGRVCGQTVGSSFGCKARWGARYRENYSVCSWARTAVEQLWEVHGAVRIDHAVHGPRVQPGNHRILVRPAQVSNRLIHQALV